uniref:Ig-like domain-containing protein n=1 Tax=Anas platyrhynchos platyrhynchos TaxID=8840 RepID=A0A493SU50_ANAPP
MLQVPCPTPRGMLPDTTQPLAMPTHLRTPCPRAGGLQVTPLPVLPHPHSSQDPQSKRVSCPPLSQPLAFVMVLQAPTPNLEGFPHPISAPGSHTVQRMYGCDLLEDGSIRGFDQYGYEGTDFLALDEDMLTYTAADTAAQITKRKWEEDGTVAERRKYYLENTCIEWLRKYVSYGKDVLERRERPEVRVSGMEANKILTLSCRAHGFYPRPISISWLKDGMVQEQETKRGSTVPNSDGTYHVWATIDVLPGDRDKYQCRVEHASLPQPGLFSWGEPKPQSNLIPIVAGVAVAVVAVIAALAGFAVWKSKGAGGRQGL